MELRQLSYFECLYRERNVTRAAARLNIVQSALSMQIAKLENEFGHALFDRTRRGVTPTAAGERAYTLFAPLLEQLTEARDAVAGEGTPVTGSVRIGLIASATNEALADTVARFAQTHPDVRIHATYGFSAELIEQVRSGALDCAVVNQSFVQEDLDCQDILDEELLVAAGSHTELGARAPVSLASLAGMDLVLPSQRHGLRIVLDDALRAHAMAVHPRLEIDDLSVIASLVARSRHVTVLPASLVEAGLRAGTLRTYPLARPGLSRRMLCVRLPDCPRSDAAALFVDGLATRLEMLARSSVQLTDPVREDDDDS
ncbi:LysR family transcriptional regulator [Pseudonocardia sp. KRD291]|uniref:LysR family transcriptional regulator n=1 Tax=Pseudonocardia sp. KRD291 TaxID=2792007 RepID=UPI001C4A3473|nr:LysR family transcriptional regulator [Pseudonocardia sp. KRD291]MBW0104105.1 LysR family transcriptional regulator [Pseudonocardia sp. KRD291]